MVNDFDIAQAMADTFKCHVDFDGIETITKILYRAIWKDVDRIRYLSKHGKNRRTRKKNAKRYNDIMGL